MHLTLRVACEDGNCPAVFETGAGDFVVQGVPVVATSDLPPGRSAVRIPGDLLARLGEQLPVPGSSAVFETSTGDFVVQGVPVAAGEMPGGLPPGESAVLVRRELLVRTPARLEAS